MRMITPKRIFFLKCLTFIIISFILCNIFGIYWTHQSIHIVNKYSNSVTFSENDKFGHNNDARQRKIPYDNEEDLMKLNVPKYDSRFQNPCWYQGAKSQKRLRCLPYFYIIGVKKSGTTTLFSMIRGHPDFADPKFKEAQWFPRRRFGDGYKHFSSYIAMFDKAAKKIADKQSKHPGDQKRKNKMITGEATPGNLHLNSHWRHLPGNEGLEEPKYVILDYIHHFLPQAKMVIVFRDPVERLYSDYYHEYGTLLKYPNTSKFHFHKIVTEGLKLYRDCFSRCTIRCCVYNESIYEYTKMQIQLGIYYVFWEELTRVFPRNQISIVHNGNLKKNLKLAVQNTLRFLNMSPLNDSTFKRLSHHVGVNQRKPKYAAQGDMLQKTRGLLEDFYRPFNYKMYNLTSDKQFLYTY